MKLWHCEVDLGKHTENNTAKVMGKYASLYQELYFLSLVKADKRFLILTNEEMYRGFQSRSKGKIADGIELMFCQLPESMCRRMKIIGDEASREMTR